MGDTGLRCPEVCLGAGSLLMPFVARSRPHFLSVFDCRRADKCGPKACWRSEGPSAMAVFYLSRCHSQIDPLSLQGVSQRGAPMIPPRVSHMCCLSTGCTRVHHRICLHIH